MLLPYFFTVEIQQPQLTFFLIYIYIFYIQIFSSVHFGNYLTIIIFYICIFFNIQIFL